MDKQNPSKKTINKKSINKNDNKKKTVKKVKKSEKTDQIDRLLSKIDYLENRIKTIPGNLNTGLRSFYAKNKYIIFVIVGMVLASYGYNIYNKIKDYNKTGETVSTSINKLNKVINTDDLYLNDTQKLFKNFYIYLTQTNVNDRTQFNILKELYNKHTNIFIEDAETKLQNQFRTSTLPYLRRELDETILPDINKFVQETTIPQSISQLRAAPGNLIGDTVDTVTGGFVSAASGIVSAAASGITVAGAVLLGRNLRCKDLQGELFGHCNNNLSEFEKLLKELSKQDIKNCLKENEIDIDIFFDAELDKMTDKMTNKDTEDTLNSIIQMYKDDAFGSPKAVEDRLNNFLECLKRKTQPSKGWIESIFNQKLI